MKGHNLLGHVKLLPECRRVLEPLNQAAGGLGEKCGQETNASQKSSADDAKRAWHGEDSQYSSKGKFYDSTK